MKRFHKTLPLSYININCVTILICLNIVKPSVGNYFNYPFNYFSFNKVVALLEDRKSTSSLLNACYSIDVFPVLFFFFSRDEINGVFIFTTLQNKN